MFAGELEYLRHAVVCRNPDCIFVSSSKGVWKDDSSRDDMQIATLPKETV